MGRLNQGLSRTLKKIYVISDWENTTACWEASEQSEVLVNKCGLFQKPTGGFEVVVAMQPRKTLQFLPSFKLGNSISIT